MQWKLLVIQFEIKKFHKFYCNFSRKYQINVKIGGVVFLNVLLIMQLSLILEIEWKYGFDKRDGIQNLKKINKSL